MALFVVFCTPDKTRARLCRFARKETSPKGEAFVSLRLRLLGGMHLGRKNILQFILSFARF